MTTEHYSQMKTEQVAEDPVYVRKEGVQGGGAQKGVCRRGCAKMKSTRCGATGNHNMPRG